MGSFNADTFQLNDKKSINNVQDLIFVFIIKVFKFLCLYIQQRSFDSKTLIEFEIISRLFLKGEIPDWNMGSYFIVYYKHIGTLLFFSIL